MTLTPGEVPSLFRTPYLSNNLFAYASRLCEPSLKFRQRTRTFRLLLSVRQKVGCMHRNICDGVWNCSTRSAAPRHSASLTSGIMASTNWFKIRTPTLLVLVHCSREMYQPSCAALRDPRFSEVTEFSSRPVSNLPRNGHFRTSIYSACPKACLRSTTLTDTLSMKSRTAGLFGFTQGSSIYPQDPQNLRGAYGPAEYDVRHSVNANYVWELPVKAALGGHGSDYMVKGWQVSGTIFARTGSLHCIRLCRVQRLQQNNYFGAIYSFPWPAPPPRHVAEPRLLFWIRILVSLLSSSRQPDGSTKPNPNALFRAIGLRDWVQHGQSPGPSRSCGNGPAVSFAQGRNRFRGPGYFNTDLRRMKNTKIPGGKMLRWELAFSSSTCSIIPILVFRITVSSDPTFGQIFYLEQSPTSILGSVSEGMLLRG